ncbi:hypothetical protein Msil_1613 [Methylocella silvestris BL2]|uniref:Uncharacterized protein n=1 Tax=Methylocella silvestris (strain DSM 15510 / CIP 108128 / LMG 27833 / NCIMB 13906 / BL2) TaxID=395965 RepID=B8EI79_METSB|nr:hypothetical protein [Methylocella silvestris]ACK50561.1 hypothetical protein Msil_1613 [Methylocella silvestris BL2]
MFDEFMLRVKVLDVLNSTPCRKIAFVAAGMSIMGYHYRYLADLINRCSVDIRFGTVDPSANGEYDDKTDTLRFKSRDPGFYATNESRALIVHECTHAIIDLAHPGGLVRRADNEATAWIAETIYRMLTGEKMTKTGDFYESLYDVAGKAIEAAPKGPPLVIDPRAVTLIGETLRGGDEVRAKAAGKIVPDVERMSGIPY